MSTFPQFSIPRLGRGHSLKPADFEAFLEAMPNPLVLVDLAKQKILSSNSKTAELSGYALAELGDLDLNALLPDWKEIFQHVQPLADLKSDKAEPLEGQVFELSHQNGSPVLIRVIHFALLSKGQKALLVFDAVNSSEQESEQDQSPGGFWEGLSALSSAPRHTDSSAALQEALRAAQSLSKASALAVYQAIDQRPGLMLRAQWGLNIFPSQLPAQDLALLNQPHLWKKDIPTSYSLQRTASATGLSYLASIPLGDSQAKIGLAVIGDSQNPPPEGLAGIGQILAETVTTIIEQDVKISSLEDEREEQALEVAIGSTLEGVVQEGFLILAPDFTAVRLNKAAEAILGYTTSEAAGQPAEHILIGTDTLLPALHDARQTKTTHNLGNLRLYRRNGEAFLAQVRTIPVANQDVLEAIVVLIQDMSEQEQIREQTQQLEQRAILGEFSAVFAHEVRNPINNISTGLQLMAYNLPPDDPNQAALERLQQDCDRLEELMKSVLSFSRPADYAMERLDVGLLLQRLMERLHARMARVNVQYHLQVEPGCPPIQGNLRALEQVFNNLINNAVQAMSQNGGRLALKVQVVKGPQDQQNPGFGPSTSGSSHRSTLEGRTYVEVSVADTGPGIPLEVQERIFQPFFTTNRNGSGLGLAISKRIITAHRGTIRLTSFPGGTVFYVQIPASE